MTADPLRFAQDHSLREDEDEPEPFPSRRSRRHGIEPEPKPVTSMFTRHPGLKKGGESHMDPVKIVSTADRAGAFDTDAFDAARKPVAVIKSTSNPETNKTQEGLDKACLQDVLQVEPGAASLPSREDAYPVHEADQEAADARALAKERSSAAESLALQAQQLLNEARAAKSVAARAHLDAETKARAAHYKAASLGDDGATPAGPGGTGGDESCALALCAKLSTTPESASASLDPSRRLVSLWEAGLDPSASGLLGYIALPASHRACLLLLTQSSPDRHHPPAVMRGVIELKADQHALGLEGARGLAYLLAGHGLTQLEVLALSCNALGDLGVATLADAMNAASPLQHIDLAGNR